MRIDMLEDVLKAARSKLNLKQSEVADKLGITTQTYLKWENGRSEPKVSQVGKLATVLRISEKEICQGEIQTEKVDPLEFVRRVGILISQVPQTEMLIGMHEYINDAEGFIEMLTRVSDYPYELFAAEDRDNAIFNAKLTLDIIKDGSLKGSPEDIERAKKHAMKVLGID
ncbi:helix-turn-helix transcriptional regulator [Moritella viscosa]|uniref:helix-turn-helix domain-containing protein n=1 Tax=Moritella viscosa TaxID=80854 RepID=UPI0009E2164F